MFIVSVNNAYHVVNHKDNQRDKKYINTLILALVAGVRIIMLTSTRTRNNSPQPSAYNPYSDVRETGSNVLQHVVAVQRF